MLAPVAQLDRALPSEGRGHRFKSYRVRHFIENIRSTAGRAVVIFSMLILVRSPAQAAQSPSIASTSLCGDTYLQALAPHHIAALSWQSRSPLSRAAPEQRKLPQLWDDPEVLVRSDADIILFGAGEGKMGTRLNAQALNLTWGEDFSVIKANAEIITQALNISPNVTKIWSGRLDKLASKRAQRSDSPRILYLSRSGGSAGTGTLVDTAITAAGGINVVQSSGWFTPDPEEIIALEPDLIITSYFKNGYESVQSTALRNKVVQRFISQYPNVEIDGKLWPCAGPGLIEAAELISEAIDKLP